jgi:hypothetical protein
MAAMRPAPVASDVTTASSAAASCSTVPSNPKAYGSVPPRHATDATTVRSSIHADVAWKAASGSSMSP